MPAGPEQLQHHLPPHRRFQGLGKLANPASKKQQFARAGGPVVSAAEKSPPPEPAEQCTDVRGHFDVAADGSHPMGPAGWKPLGL